jgi:hypothetical protein
MSTTPLTKDEILDELHKVARGSDQRSKLGALRMLHEMNMMERDTEEATFVRIIIGTNDVATPPLPADYEEGKYVLAWLPVETE